MFISKLFGLHKDPCWQNESLCLSSFIVQWSAKFARPALIQNAHVDLDLAVLTKDVRHVRRSPTVVKVKSSEDKVRPVDLERAKDGELLRSLPWRKHMKMEGHSISSICMWEIMQARLSWRLQYTYKAFKADAKNTNVSYVITVNNLKKFIYNLTMVCNWQSQVKSLQTQLLSMLLTVIGLYILSYELR